MAGWELLFALAVLLRGEARLLTEEAAEVRLVLETHQHGYLLDALAAVAQGDLRGADNLFADELVGGLAGETLADGREVLGCDAEKGRVLVDVEVGQGGVVEVLHELPQDVLAGAVGLVHHLLAMEGAEVAQVVGHGCEEESQAELLVGRVGTGEVVAEQVEIEAAAVHSHLVGMQYLVGRGEHGMCPFHPHHLRELGHIFGREEEHEGVEVHAHHAALEDVAGLAGDDVALLELVHHVVDRYLCLAVGDYSEEETFYQQVGNGEIAHLVEIAEDGDVFVAVEVELTLCDGLEV